MTLEKDFLEGKEKLLKSLEKAQSEDKLDHEIMSILSMINDSREYYTSSSCAGRIVLLEIPRIGNKKNARFLGKWHRTIEPDEILSAAKKAKAGQLWLLAQPPIIHIAAINNETADKMVKIANASGFKNSGVKSTGKKIVVEVCGTERLDAPIGRDGLLFCNDEYLQLLVNIANEVIEKSTVKLHRFEQKLRKYLSTHKTTK
jgi:tRNA wybutosine-synthesizing protein 3